MLLGWVWSPEGFLFKMGVLDLGGSSNVHLLGATAALTLCIIIGPREGR